MALSKPESFEYIWKTIHAFAAKATTPAKRQEFKRFVEVTIPMLLPCDGCSEHWKVNLKGKYPIDKYMGSEEQLLLWSFLMHELVSEQTGKPPEHTPSYSEIKRLYLPSPGEVICSTICEIGQDSHKSEPKVVKKKVSARRQTTFKYR